MKHVLWILVVCGVGVFSQWYFPEKYEPLIENLRASVETLNTDKVQLLKEVQTNQLEIQNLKNTLIDKNKELSCAKAESDQKLAVLANTIESLKKDAVIQRPVAVIAPSQTGPQVTTRLMPDGSIVTESSSNVAVVAKNPEIERMKIQLQILEKNLDDKQYAHDAWIKNHTGNSIGGNIPDELSEASIQELQKQIDELASRL